MSMKMIYIALQIKKHRLELVTSILKRENFYSHEDQDETSGRGEQSPSSFLQNTSKHNSIAVSASSKDAQHVSRSRTKKGRIALSEHDVNVNAPRSQSHDVAGPAGSPRKQSPKGRSSPRMSSLSRSRPPLPSASNARQGDVVLDTALNPNISHRSSLSLSRSSPSQAPDSDSEDLEVSRSQPRSYEKMQDSMMSDSTAASGIVDKISLLPDELVCVGLSMQHEHAWRNKIINALFYYGDVLPLQEHQKWPSSAGRGIAGDLRSVHEADVTDQKAHDSGSDTPIRRASMPLSTTPPPNRPLDSEPRKHMGTSTNISETSPKLLCSTKDADYPVNSQSRRPSRSLLTSCSDSFSLAYTDC